MNRIDVPMNAHLLGQNKPQEFGVSVNPGPLVAPLVIPGMMKTPEGATVVMSFGGMTKLEHGALQIAAALMTGRAESMTEATAREIAADACAMAAVVLQNCAKIQPELHGQPRQQPPAH